jgi:RES domain-containing protein
MTVYRIVKSKHAGDLSGKGSLLVEGRWHLANTLPVLYTASNRSLAILEVLAHLPSPIIKPPRLSLLDIFIPDKEITVIKESDLPKGWKAKIYQRVAQQWGTDWLQSKRSLAIAVPSAISLDHNVLINPLHEGFDKVKITGEEKDFMVDDRLI